MKKNQLLAEVTSLSSNPEVILLLYVIVITGKGIECLLDQ